MGAKPDSPEWKAAEKLAAEAKKDKDSKDTTSALINYMKTKKDDDK